MNEAEIKKTQWWWRNGGEDWAFDEKNFTTRSSKKSGWKLRIERVAFLYELARRHHPDGSMPEFDKLSQKEKENLFDTFADSVATLVVRVPDLDGEIQFDPNITDTAEWIKVPGFEINANASKAAILKAIWLQIIAPLVKDSSVYKRKRERRRGFSWRWPELMDISHHKCRPLEDDERAKLHEARGWAENAYNCFAAYFSGI